MMLFKLMKYYYFAKTGRPCDAARALGVKIGSDCRIYTRQFGSEPWLVTIGNRVTVTSDVMFVTHDGSGWLFRDSRGRRYRYAPIMIGSDVFIGVRSVILPGVQIGDRCIIGAGSVVTKSVPSGYIVAGVPAKVVGRFDKYEQRALETYGAEADMKGTRERERICSMPMHMASLMAIDKCDTE